MLQATSLSKHAYIALYGFLRIKLELLKMKDANEKDILKACKKGKRFAQKLLYNNYKVAMFTICLRYMSNHQDAEDMLQEGWVYIFKNIQQYDETKASFYSWARRIFINANLQYLRKKRVFKEDLESTEVSLISEETTISNLTMEEMVDMLHALPEGYRTVFNLYAIEGYSHKEIAEHLGISVSTSKTQLMKAKKQLQSMIKLAYAI